MFFRLTCRALQPHTTHYLTPIFSIHTFALNADAPLQLMLKLNLDCTIILEMLNAKHFWVGVKIKHFKVYDTFSKIQAKLLLFCCIIPVSVRLHSSVINCRIPHGLVSLSGLYPGSAIVYHQGSTVHVVEGSVRSAEESGGHPSVVIEDIDIMSSHLVIKGTHSSFF